MSLPIRDLLNTEKKTFSLEIFPPKGQLTQVDVNRVVCNLNGINPDWISVTCSAGGTGSKDNIETAKFIRSCGYSPVVHLTCVGETVSSVLPKLDTYASEGIKDLMILRGDLPQTSAQSDFDHACDLVKLVKSQYPDFCVGVAAYPEVHPESRSFQQDIDYLKLKQDCGADYAITQLFYYNEAFYRLRDVAVRNGVTIPIIPGVMPVISRRTLSRICSISNITVDTSLFSVMTMFGDYPECMHAAGLAYTTKQIVDLLSNGVIHIHLYTMNRPEIANSIYNNVRPLFKEDYGRP